MMWQAVIFGPDDTPWEGGTFKLVLEFTEDYPNWRFLDDMFLLNPFYVYVSLVREVLMSSYSHNNPPLVWLAAVVWAVVAMTGGMYYFVGAEKRYGRG
jgi:ubiquitin-conjugating enzyme E2 A